MNNIETSNSNPSAAEAPENRIKLPAFITPKRIIWFVVIAGLIALTFVYKGLFVAATVDGQPITRIALVNELEGQYGREALDALITKVLIENEADKHNIQISEQEIDDEVKKLGDQIAEQGGALDDLLETQGITRDQLRDQVKLQLKAERIVGDKIEITDEEINQYVSDSGQPLEAGKEEEQKAMIKDGLRQEKFNKEIATWLEGVRKSAAIKEYVQF